MSGFANSSGGVIIWGVEACRQNGEELDVACGLPMVKDASLLLNKLNEHTGTLVAPTVEGVRHEAIIANNEGSGFVKTLIPESLTGPHMSNREKVYYKRSGDSFYKMEHYDIADMFGKRQKPKLTFEASPGVINRNQFHMKLAIRNTGKALARSVYVALNINRPFSLTSLNTWRTISGNDKYPHRFITPTAIVIHPDTSLRSFDIEVPSRKRSAEGLPQTIALEYKISAEDMPTTTGKHVVWLSKHVPSKYLGVFQE